MSKRESKLGELDDIADGVVSEHGTMYTEVFDLDRSIRRKMEECYELGCTVREVTAILLKYSVPDAHKRN